MMMFMPAPRARRLLDERRNDPEISQADHYGQAHHADRDEAEVGGCQNPRKHEDPDQKYDFFDREAEAAPHYGAAGLPRERHERLALSDSAPSPGPAHTCPGLLSAEANATLCFVRIIEIMDDRIVSFGRRGECDVMFCSNHRDHGRSYCILWSRTAPMR
jgi:hypothetical protein